MEGEHKLILLLFIFGLWSLEQEEAKFNPMSQTPQHNMPWTNVSGLSFTCLTHSLYDSEKCSRVPHIQLDDANQATVLQIKPNKHEFLCVLMRMIWGQWANLVRILLPIIYTALYHCSWLMGKGLSIFCLVIACHRTVHHEITHRGINALLALHFTWFKPISYQIAPNVFSIMSFGLI